MKPYAPFEGEALPVLPRWSRRDLPTEVEAVPGEAPSRRTPSQPPGAQHRAVAGPARPRPTRAPRRCRGRPLATPSSAARAGPRPAVLVREGDGAAWRPWSRARRLGTAAKQAQAGDLDSRVGAWPMVTTGGGGPERFWKRLLGGPPPAEAMAAHIPTLIARPGEAGGRVGAPVGAGEAPGAKWARRRRQPLLRSARWRMWARSVPRCVGVRWGVGCRWWG